MTQYQHSSFPPIFNTNDLHRGERLRIKYDRDGNPIAMWKEERFQPCFLWAVIIVLAIVAGLVWYYFGDPEPVQRVST